MLSHDRPSILARDTRRRFWQPYFQRTKTMAEPLPQSASGTAHRLLILTGGLAGAAGVALSALAAHEGGGHVATVAAIFLAHAPVLLCIGLLGRGRVAASGGVIVLVGIALFCSDLLMRHYAGVRLFPYAAPAGGTAMIAGWLVIASSALSHRP